MSRVAAIAAALAAYVPESAVELVEVIEFDGQLIAVNSAEFDAFQVALRSHNAWAARRWEKSKHKAWTHQPRDPGYTKDPDEEPSDA